VDPTSGGATDNTDLRAQAIHELRKRQAYRIHLNSYLLVSALLIGIWLAVNLAFDGTWFPWPVFPILGWGIGLFFHRQATFGWRISESDIEREIERLQGEK
jgi:2TM domain-containing protein